MESVVADGGDGSALLALISMESAECNYDLNKFLEDMNELQMKHYNGIENISEEQENNLS